MINKLTTLSALILVTSCAHSTPTPDGRYPAGFAVDAGAVTAITPRQFMSHYQLDELHAQGFTGAGQHIAILNYDKVTDDMKASIALFFREVGSRAAVNWIGDGSDDDDAPSELEIDVEMAGMVAPAAVIDVFSFPDKNRDAHDLGAIFDHPEIKILSSSWSPCEKQISKGHMAATDKLIQRAADNNMTILYASGDDGLACNSYRKKAPDGTNTRSWPTTNPFVTAVGATSFEPLSDGGFTEVAWHFAGGGPSLLYAMPDYQAGKLPADYDRNGGSRGIPDISMLGGEPRIQVLSKATGDSQPKWFAKRGTSYAAPELAGLIALVNQGRARVNKEPIGPLNPILYGLLNDDNAEIRARVLQNINRSDNGKSENNPKWNSESGVGPPIPEEFVKYLIGL